jgi:NitT/TauT family transport system substrate-binding protein
MASSKFGRAWLKALAALGMALGAAMAAHADDKVTLLTTWFAQAEHGGFYQALATGLYKKYGLDVTIKMGGPQVNGLQLLAAGETDFALNRDFAVLQAVQRGLPFVTVAAPLQFDDQGLMTHEDVTGLGGLMDKTILIAGTANLYYWPWLKKKYGYTDAQSRPYTNNLQPFFADHNIVQQALPGAEPFQAAQKGVKVKFFPFVNEGYPPYRGAIVTTQKTIDERPDVVKRFVQASMEGWKSFLANPAPAAAIIKKENPAMTDAEIAFGVKTLIDEKIVTGGEAARLGVGAMTDERWAKTRDFMIEYGLLKPETDVHRAYTLQFVKDLKVMP